MYFSRVNREIREYSRCRRFIEVLSPIRIGKTRKEELNSGFKDCVWERTHHPFKLLVPKTSSNQESLSFDPSVWHHSNVGKTKNILSRSGFWSTELPISDQGHQTSAS
ncbi:hypothetical protein EUGRSUZ_C01050 [Eucalyptus grandis]|uniref:Uncharacterized protein n=2 Tax=Eucalyptus grandis TaxID=71139 RepID=A0ACC3LC58_EUCGR|nr:hypothetical protein EUGRSUZ_C01050 [Eucalyptus grandis]